MCPVKLPSFIRGLLHMPCAIVSSSSCLLGLGGSLMHVRWDGPLEVSLTCWSLSWSLIFFDFPWVLKDAGDVAPYRKTA